MGYNAPKQTVSQFQLKGRYARQYLSFLNCETHNAYNASGFCNETILSEDFPELPEGKTQITWTGGITAVEVTPRWWTL